VISNMPTPTVSVHQSDIEESVYEALKEDVGSGDITADLIPEDSFSLATVITREDCVFCGMDWFEEVYQQLDEEIFVEWNVQDGDSVSAGDAICSISGSTRSLLTGERTSLNFIQTLSATATIAKQYADAVADTDTIILDTRKTVPGLRLAQKYAVSCGGCQNHRLGLYDAILIKENHISACGSIKKAIESARFKNPELPIEIEVENLGEVEQAIAANADRLLLDNFDTKKIRQAIKLCGNKIPLEASGGITLDNVHEIAQTGIDYISVGSLTKDIRAIDLSMCIS